MERPDERSQLEALTKELQQTKMALAEAHIDLVVAKAEYQVLCQAHGITDVAAFKNTHGMKSSRPQ